MNEKQKQNKSRTEHIRAMEQYQSNICIIGNPHMLLVGMQWQCLLEVWQFLIKLSIYLPHDPVQ